MCESERHIYEQLSKCHKSKTIQMASMRFNRFDFLIPQSDHGKVLILERINFVNIPSFSGTFQLFDDKDQSIFLKTLEDLKGTTSVNLNTEVENIDSFYLCVIRNL